MLRGLNIIVNVSMLLLHHAAHRCACRCSHFEHIDARCALAQVDSRLAFRTSGKASVGGIRLYRDYFVGCVFVDKSLGRVRIDAYGCRCLDIADACLACHKLKRLCVGYREVGGAVVEAYNVEREFKSLNNQ